MRLITIAIHTYPYAQHLKQTLADAGIEATLQNVNLENPIVAPGVRVRIHEHDLANALRIIETACPAPVTEPTAAGKRQAPRVLIPIDFSSYSDNACRFGLAIASANNGAALLLHSFITPSMLAPAPLSSELNFDITDNMAEDARLDKDAEKRMHAFGKHLQDEIDAGKEPPALFEMKVCEGVPEEAIAETAKNVSPMLIVMGTRATVKKEQELIGSVSAEVIDTVRCPVLTLPENSKLADPSSIRRIMFFAMPDQQDILAVDTLQRLLNPGEGSEVTIVNVPSRRATQSQSDSLGTLARYCTDHYPLMRFSTMEVTADNIEETLSAFHNTHGIDLLVIPTRRRNIFSRLFNPTLAHRLLFRTDLPMLAIPV